jgi:hypothetical protein
MIIYIIFITIIVVGILYFISQPGNSYLAYAEPSKPTSGKQTNQIAGLGNPVSGKGVAVKPTQSVQGGKINQGPTGQSGGKGAPRPVPKPNAPKPTPKATPKPAPAPSNKGNFAVGADKKPLSDKAILNGLNAYGKGGKVSLSSNFYKDSVSGKFDYDKKTGKWTVKSSTNGSSNGPSGGKGNFAVGSNKKPLSDAEVLKGLNQFGKGGKVSTSSNFFKDSTSGKFDYNAKTGTWFIKGSSSSGPSSNSGGKGNFAIGKDKKPLSDAEVLKGLNQFGKGGKVSTSSNFFKDSTSGKFDYNAKTGTWFIKGSASSTGPSSSGNNFAVGSNKQPLSDAAVLSGLNTFGKDGKLSPSSNFYQDSTSGKFTYDAKTKTWSIKGNVSAGSTNPQYAIQALNQYSADGKVSTSSSYFAAVQAGIYKYDDKTKSWYINTGAGVGGSGTGSTSAGSANPQYALKALNQYSADGKVSTSSSYFAAVQAGIYKYDDKTKSWYINTGATGSGVSSGASAGTQYTGTSITGYTGGQLPTNPEAKTTVDQQALRNLNRMYGNGKVPLNSDYAGLVASGQVVWDATNHAWMATTGSAVGYIGVGQATQQDVRNLNRLFPDGNVTVGSRFANLVASGNIAWDPTNKTWVPTVGKFVGYTGTGTTASGAGAYVGTNADGSQYVTSGSGPVSGGSGYFPGVTVGGGASAGYVDPYATTGGYVDPNAGGYVDPNAGGYVDPNAGGYVDPNAGGYSDAGYSDPYAGYSDAGLW